MCFYTFFQLNIDFKLFASHQILLLAFHRVSETLMDLVLFQTLSKHLPIQKDLSLNLRPHEFLIEHDCSINSRICSRPFLTLVSALSASALN